MNLISTYSDVNYMLMSERTPGQFGFAIVGSPDVVSAEATDADSPKFPAETFGSEGELASHLTYGREPRSSSILFFRIPGENGDGFLLAPELTRNIPEERVTYVDPPKIETPAERTRRLQNEASLRRGEVRAGLELIGFPLTLAKRLAATNISTERLRILPDVQLEELGFGPKSRRQIRRLFGNQTG